MKKTYIVHGAHKQSVQSKATLPGGQVVDASITAFVVELVPKDDPSGTLKLAFTDHIEDAISLFAEGAPIQLTFEPEAE